MNALVKYERIYDNNISYAIVYVAVAHCKSQHLFAYPKSIEMIFFFWNNNSQSIDIVVVIYYIEVGH